VSGAIASYVMFLSAARVSLTEVETEEGKVGRIRFQSDPKSSGPSSQCLAELRRHVRKTHAAVLDEINDLVDGGEAEIRTQIDVQVDKLQREATFDTRTIR